MSDIPDFMKAALGGFSATLQPIKPSKGMSTEELIQNMNHNAKLLREKK